MNEDVNTRLLKVEHRQETIEKVAHEVATTQKETNESINALTQQLGRLIDKFDSISESQKEHYKQLKENTSRLDKMESSTKLFNSIISAIILGAVTLGYNLISK